MTNLLVKLETAHQLSGVVELTEEELWAINFANYIFSESESFDYTISHIPDNDPSNKSEPIAKGSVRIEHPDNMYKDIVKKHGYAAMITLWTSGKAKIKQREGDHDSYLVLDWD